MGNCFYTLPLIYLEKNKFLYLFFRYLNRLTAIIGIYIFVARSENASLTFSVGIPSPLLWIMSLWQKKSLCIGSGSFYLPTFINYDLPSKSFSYFFIQGIPYIDFIPLDLTKENYSLPHNYQMAYISHVLEHLSYDSVCVLFRKLNTKNKYIRIAAPDQELAARSLLNILMSKKSKIENESSLLTDCNFEPYIYSLAKEVNHCLLYSTSIQSITYLKLIIKSCELTSRDNKIFDSLRKLEEKLAHNCADKLDPSCHISFWNLNRFNYLLNNFPGVSIKSVARWKSFNDRQYGPPFDMTNPSLSNYFEVY